MFALVRRRELGLIVEASLPRASPPLLVGLEEVPRIEVVLEVEEVPRTELVLEVELEE